MQKFDSFEKIVFWQKARAFNKQIYLLTANDNFKKDIELSRQMRRASISITSDIAEGFERKIDKEFVYFLYVAKASAGEMSSQLYLAHDFSYIGVEKFNEMLENITKNIAAHQWIN